MCTFFFCLSYHFVSFLFSVLHESMNLSRAALSETLEPPHLASLLIPRMSKKTSHLILCFEVVCISEQVCLIKWPLCVRTPDTSDTFCHSAKCVQC